MLSDVGALVRVRDRRRFLTALFAPAERREALFTLYAFNHELARAREVASQPMLALIRLQWWREVVEGAVRRHEVATPLSALMAEGVLPRQGLLRLIEGREMEVEAEAGEAWRECLQATGGRLMALAGAVLGAEEAAAALIQVGAGCAAAGHLANLERLGAVPAPVFDGVGAQDVRAFAIAEIGRPRRWSATAIPAVLPCVFGRRDLAGHLSEGLGSRLALLAAASSRRC